MLSLDLKEVNQIANTVWGAEFYEAPEVFEQKFMSYPEGCFVYDAGAIKGYAFSHPGILNCPPKLNDYTDITQANDYHIHDVVLLPDERGKNLLDDLMAKIMELAGPFGTVSLVAVNGTDTHWIRRGFRAVLNIDVSNYSNTAVYMITPLET